MWIHYAVLLGVVVVVASTNATLLTKDLTSDHSVLVVHGGASTGRFLRIQSTTGDDEERVFGIKSIPGVNKVSNFLNNKKLAKYLKTDKEVDDVFVKLKLNSPNKNVFENPKFLKWSQYVDDFNQKNLGQEPKSMLPTLLRHYDGVQLSTMLEAATKVDSTYGVAKRLQGEQMKLWRREGVTADYLFSFYKLDVLDDGVKNLLAKPGVNIFIRYADEFNPGVQTTLFEKLRKTYSDTVLSQLLIAGMKDPNTKTLATELQAKQGAENLLVSPQLYTWVKYAERYKANNEFTAKRTLFDALRSHYSDDALVTMLRSASRVKAKRDTLYVRYVENALLDDWAKAKKPASEVLTALGVTHAKKNEVMAAYSEKVLALDGK
ncbi:Avirulence (Avh) protein [Phytophthora megakarya]|uniref:RxLR effector protein n=1 Tax=Phytophthora megakarya TaxID=4795 RepID=A0A225VP82_9STRA|nr:Avirulence (Avh) protein [Phytophthora megakarya]